MWSDERIEELRARWNDGQSASVIATAFGTTRNAIIGKANRLQLGKHRVTKTAARGHCRVSMPRVKGSSSAPVLKRKKATKQPPARTRTELYAMLAEAVRNTAAMGASQ